MYQHGNKSIEGTIVELYQHLCQLTLIERLLGPV